MDKNAQIVLNQLNFDANVKNINWISEFQAGIYRFRFKEPLENELMIGFTEYVRKLELTKLKAIMQIWVWLYQHDAKFRLVFGYDWNKSVTYNIKNLLKPRKIQNMLLSYGHNRLMNCPSDKVPEGFYDEEE